MQSFIDKMASAFQNVEVLAHPDAVVLKGFPRAVQFLDRHSCGEKAVWCILRYFGVRISHSRLAKMLGTDEDGTDVSDIKRVFGHFKLECRTLRKPNIATLEHCIKQGRPVLISVFGGEHYAVVFGVSPTHLFVANSSLDARLSGVGSIGSAVPRKEFREYWDRWGLAVSRP